MESKSLKKISFSLQVGLIGLEDSGKEIFLDYLEKKSIQTNLSNINEEDNNNKHYFLVRKQVPIKIRVYLAESLNDIINNHEKIKKLDVLILALNLYNLNSKNKYNIKDLERLIKIFSFKGTSVLAGLDTEQIYHGEPSNDFRISRYNLIQKAKELDLLYCFEIRNGKKDIKELYHKVLQDFILKFQISNPNMLEKSKIYGKELLNPE